MEGRNYILVLLFVFSAGISQAQENRVYIPPDPPETYHFAMPELQVDTVFIKNLNTILFNVRYGWSSRTEFRNFLISFEEIDSMYYSIQVMLYINPGRNSTGFFEQNGYFYWLGGEIPPTIILETKSIKQFSFTEYVGFIDPPFWFLMYNKQDGSIVFKTNDYLEYLRYYIK